MRFKREVAVIFGALLIYVGYLFVRTLFVGFGGFIGNTYVTFPADEYTFIVKVGQDAGRSIIKDNLWGFKYPSLSPLKSGDRKDFIKRYPDWVRVSVGVRDNPDLCFGQVIKKYTDPEQTPLSLYTNKRKNFNGYNARAVMNVVAYEMYGLKAMVPPEVEYFKDSSIYQGPSVILWSKGSGGGEACTYISCTQVSNDLSQQYCTHKYIDRKSRLVFSMTYNRGNLASWNDIERQTRKIFETFKRVQ